MSAGFETHLRIGAETFDAALFRVIDDEGSWTPR
jgi:hypothetical protein